MASGFKTQTGVERGKSCKSRKIKTGSQARPAKAPSSKAFPGLSLDKPALSLDKVDKNMAADGLVARSFEGGSQGV
jgi:hypothetical protein